MSKNELFDFVDKLCDKFEVIKTETSIEKKKNFLKSLWVFLRNENIIYPPCLTTKDQVNIFYDRSNEEIEKDYVELTNHLSTLWLKTYMFSEYFLEF
jgi:hypothetical protein